MELVVGLLFGYLKIEWLHCLLGVHLNYSKISVHHHLLVLEISFPSKCWSDAIMARHSFSVVEYLTSLGKSFFV